MGNGCGGTIKKARLYGGPWLTPDSKVFEEVGSLMKCMDHMVWEYGNLLGGAGRISFVISYCGGAWN